MSKFVKKLSGAGTKESDKKSSSGSGSGSEWKKASHGLGLFEPAKGRYEEVKKILDNDHPGEGFDLWYKSTGETIISKGTPPKDIQTEQGKTLGAVNFNTKDVKERGKWDMLGSLAKKEKSDDESWKNIF